ncbi:MAG TPA: T9SS type A sorting domain-containing protein [bacterium]|nr:T9SS type A sorting domain-containing protein [bacterium]
MKRSAFKFVSVLITGLVFSLQAGTGGDSGTGNMSQSVFPVDPSAEYFPGEIFVCIGNAGAEKAMVPVRRTLSAFGVTDLTPLVKSATGRHHSLAGIHQARIAPGIDPADAAEEAARQPGVLWAEPVYVRRPAYVPDDPDYPQQWYLPKIMMESAWDVFLTARPDRGEPVLIGIVDTGVLLDHPDLRERIWTNPGEIPGNGLDDDGNGYVDDVHGWDFGDNNNDPNPASEFDDAWHGTAVAAVAAAMTDNQIGLASPLLNARILPVKASSSDDSEQRIRGGYAGIVYAIDQGADLINLSFGGAGASNAELAVIQYALDHDVLIVAAAGNESNDKPFYPGSYSGVLSVAATDENDLKASFSNWGVRVDVAAPGRRMYAPWGNENYLYVSGTSFSSPLTAGAAGLLKQYHAGWTARQIAEQIRVTADPVDALNPAFAALMGSGRINVYRALTEVVPAIRISDFGFDDSDGGNANGIAEPGETLTLTFTVTNYLASFSGGEIRIAVQDDRPHIRLQNNQMALPAMQTGATWQNTHNPVLVTIADEAARGDEIFFRVDIWDGAEYYDRDWIRLQIAPPYVTVGTGGVRLSVSSDGRLGFIDYPENFIGEGFVFTDAGNLLFEGAFMAGIGPDTLSDVARGADQTTQNDDFSPLSGTEVFFIRSGDYGDEEAHAVFSDEDASVPMGLEVSQTVVAFHDSESEQFVLISYELANMKDHPIRDLRAGLFMDWDIADASDNLAGFDPALDLGYIYDPNDNIHGGLAVVSRGGATSYALVNNPAEIYDGYTKQEKWSHLSGGIRNTIPRTRNDYSHVLSVGPVTLFPDRPVRIGFAVIGGEDLGALRRNAQHARDRWNTLFPDEPDPYARDPFSLSVNFPNPFNPNRAETVIHFWLSEWTMTTLTIYDLMGREVTRLIDGYQEAGSHEVTWNGKSRNGPVPSGVYLMRLTAGNRSRSRKILLVR